MANDDPLEKIRRRLLDLTRRNQLLNYKHPRLRSIRIVDELPDQLFKALYDGATFTFAPVPEPPKFKDADERIRDMYPDRAGQRVRPDAVAWARHKGIDTGYDLPSTPSEEDARHRDRKIQTLFYPEDLESQLGNIARLARTAMEESGVNVLYLAFGFLEWRQTEDADPNLAPLLLLPVTITKAGIDAHTHRYKYEVKYSDEDLGTNISLRELLKSQFGLELPDLEEEDTPEGYLKKCEPLLKAKPEWRLHRHVTLGFFQFGKQLLYLDLDPSNWPEGHELDEHDIIHEMLAGRSGASAGYADVHPVDDLKPTDPEFQLIQEADSSQHSAIIDAAAGRSMVIEGPPGTGKSQTITNIIAVALNQGKSVLFVAEKLAALKVVKDRLDKAGLGKFCLELHSNRTNKKTFYEDLRRRRAFRVDATRHAALATKGAELERAKKVLNTYAELMGRRLEGLDINYSDLFARCAGLQARIPKGTLKPDDLKCDTHMALDHAWLATMESRVTRAEDIRGNIARVHGSVEAHPWSWLAPKLPGLAAPLDEAADWLVSLRGLADATTPLSAGGADSATLTPRRLSAIAALQSGLPAPRDLPVEPLARILSDVAEMEILHGQASREEAFSSEHARMTARYGAARVADPSWLPSVEAAAKTIEKAPIRLGDRAVNAALEIRDAISAWVAAQQDVASAIADVQGHFSIKVGSGLDAPRACAMILAVSRNTPFEALPNRFAGLEQITDIKAVEAIQVEIDSLVQERNRANLFFHVAATEDLGRLSAAAEVLQQGGVLSFLDGQWRNANDVYRQVCRAKSWFKPSRRKGKELADLVKLRARLQEFANHPAHSALLGRGYRGLETPVRQYTALIRWFEEAKKSVGQHGTHTAVSLALTSLSEEKLRSLKALGSGEQAHTLERGQALLGALAGRLSAVEVQQVVGEPTAVPPAATWIGGLGEALDMFAGGMQGAEQKVAAIRAMLQEYGKHATDQERIRGRELLGLRNQPGIPLEEQGKAAFDSLIAWAGALWSADGGEILRGYYSEAIRRNEVPAAYEALGGLVSAVAAEATANVALSGRFYLFRGQAESDGTGRDTPIDIAEAAVSKAMEHAEEWESWSSYADSVLAINALDGNLAQLTRPYHRGEISAAQLLERAQYLLLNTHVRMLKSEHEILKNFSVPSHQALIAKFADLDRQVCELHRQLIAANVSKRRPPQGHGGARVKDLTELALLDQQMSLNQPRMSMRRVMAKAGRALKELKPCFMMGPLSVAQFLEPGSIHFDLIVMDEASQMRPEDALGAVARGTQLIVVGDPKQLPPTTFFDKLSADDGTAPAEDAPSSGDQESILQMAMPILSPPRMLEWHYRSQHESLIAFSNHQFYADRLRLFPTALHKNEGLGIHYHHVADGSFKGGVNQREAAEVVRAAMREIRRTGGEQTIAIVAMNVEQTAAIRQEWERRLKEMDDLRALVDKLEARETERFDIKNLENVQGDERDIIVISMTYGPDPDGHFFQRFGPINWPDGWRRLNVLFTRARRKMAVYSSMHSSKVLPGSQSSGGTAALRGFLEYCERGRLIDLPVQTDRPPANEFEEQVIAIVKEEGFGAEPQVGVKGYFIDIGVTHPAVPGTYLLGIECDGSQYHSLKFARDRDRLREQVLVSMGWTIHRVWAPDWFSWDRTAQQRLREALRRLKETLPEAPPVMVDRRTLERDPDSLRDKLHGLRRTLEQENPDVPAPKRLLRNEMLELLVQHRPTSSQEFLLHIPEAMRIHTDPSEAAGHLDTVLSIIEDHG